MSPVEWTAVGIIVSTNLTMFLGTVGYLGRRLDRLEDRFDRLEERYIQHLEHHAHYA